VATRVVTDSACDLPPVSLLDAGVVAVPLRVRFGDAEMLDGRDLRPTELYRRLAEGGPPPRTRPPDPDDFAAVYRALLSEADELVSLHLSSELSETLTHAHEGAKRAGVAERVRVVDSRAAGAALAEQVLAAARAAAAGRDAAETAAAAERVRDATVTLLAPASLRDLRARGRVGPLRAWWNGARGRLPLFRLEGGALLPSGSVPRAGRAEQLARHLEAALDGGPTRVVVGVAGDDLAAADELLAWLEASSLRIGEGRVQRVGVALARYLGPGTLTLSGYPEEALVAPAATAA
jgi:DegV family protein with EDD domain